MIFNWTKTQFMRWIACIFLMHASSISANLTEDIAELSKGHTEFAFSLYPTIDAAETNLVFSPYSISSCLSMVYMGARGETESQIQKALHLNIPRKNIAKSDCGLTQSLLPLKSDDKSYVLNIANAMWVDQGTFLLTDFRYAIEEQFKSKLAKINFAMPTLATNTINEWISLQTQGKIAALLSSNDINEQTRLVLTNAIYFQGKWNFAFDPQLTHDWPFHPTPDTSLSVKMLEQTFSVPYYENEFMQAIALPFSGSTKGKGSLAFLAILPKSADNFDLLLHELPSQFNTWLSSLTPAFIHLKLPKFFSNSRYDLNQPLQELGMENAFDSDANFMGIDGVGNLILSKVIHQTYFLLDENGVTAASATAASLNVTSMPSKSPPIQMTLDHPFFFFIVDLKSQEMLFMGKIVQPTTQQ